MNTDKAIKKAEEERDELVEQAEALLEDSDGELSDEQKEEFNQLKEKAEEKNEYISAKKWQEQEKARQAQPYEKQVASEKEVKRFSMSEFMMSVHPGMRDELDEKTYSFYTDLSKRGKEQARDAGAELQGGQSKVIPYDVLKKPENDSGYRADLTVGTEGTDIVFTEDGGFIDQLNERMVLTNLGTDFMTGLTGDVKFPRETNAPTATWEGETDANAESTPTFDNVSLSPNRVGTFIDVSNQAILQTNPAIDARIERQLVGAIQRELERVAIEGSGASPIPEGILNTTGIGSADVGTNGGAQTWANWIDNETEVSQDDADIGSLAYLTNAKVRGQAKQTFIDTGSGRTIWPVNANEVNGYPVGVTNLVPDDLTKGTGTALSALIFGNFNDLIVAQWGGLEVLVDPFTQATSGMTRMVINVYADIAVLHAESFSATQDIDTTA